MKQLVLFRLVMLLAVVLFVPASRAEDDPRRGDGVPFCAPFDYEQWRRDHPRPAGKALQDLNKGEPRTVRMIYFLPNDRPDRAEVVQKMVVQKMKDEIVRIQTFYAEQMQAHGHGNATFRIETDAQGAPKVHRVNGQHPNSHYLQHDTADEVLEELDPIFDLEANVYLIVIDSRDGILANGRAVLGVGFRASKSGGYALVGSRVWFDTAAHELGHAFGLPHDFRDDAYMMSYGYPRDRLSACNAEFLAVHTYFNRNSSTSESARPTSQLISTDLYPPGSAVPIRLRVGGTRGLHQVLLLGTTREPHSAAGGSEVLECRGFAGQKEAVARFDYDGTIPSSPLSSLSDFATHSLGVNVVDADGNLARRSVGLRERPSYLVATLEGHADEITSLSFSPDGTLLASGSRDNTIQLWNVATRQRVATLTGGLEMVSSVLFSPDGTLLAAGVEWKERGGGNVELWDVASRQRVAEIFGWNYQMSFSPDGTLLAIGQGLWDVARRLWVALLFDWSYSLSFSPDGTLLASGALDDTIQLWNVATRQRVATLEVEGTVYSVSFSPDGTLLAAVKQDNTIQLWNVATRQRVATLEVEGPGTVYSVSFSPDGTLLAAGAEREKGFGLVELWDVASRQRVATLLRGLGGTSVSFSPDGTLLASSRSFSPDGDLLGSSSHPTIGLLDVAKLAAQVPHSLTKVSGDGQNGSARARLAKPLVVSVLDQDGSPLPGVRVVFATDGRALLSSASDADRCAVGSSASSIVSYTNANGQASVRLTLLGTSVGILVKATVEGLEPVTFTAIKSGQAIPHRLTKVCGDSQEGLVDEQLAESFVVSVSDENGAAIAGVAVSFSVTAGEGTLSSATSTTDANGRAATSLTLGSESGTNTVEAAVEGLRSVTFTATGEKSALASLFDVFEAGKRASLPDRTQLLQNAPNPFNSQTVLSYFLLAPGPVRLEVFALSGQRVAVLHQGPQQAGYHRLHWDGRNAAGHSVASGAYLYRLVTDEAVLTRKLILLR